jgi:BirA family biotin operon repressor/biotin-[acetyl-CoA-carboxylase] ligase
MQHEIDLKEALTAVCRALDHRYLMLKSGDFSTLDNDFKARLLGYGLWRNYLRDGSVFEGKITGVDDLGCLMIEMHDGRVECFGHREVEYCL